MQYRVYCFKIYLSIHLSFSFRERKDIRFVLRLDYNKMLFFLLFPLSLLEAVSERNNDTYLQQFQQEKNKCIWF